MFLLHVSLATIWAVSWVLEALSCSSPAVFSWTIEKQGHDPSLRSALSGQIMSDHSAGHDDMPQNGCPCQRVWSCLSSPGTKERQWIKPVRSSEVGTYEICSFCWTDSATICDIMWYKPTMSYILIYTCIVSQSIPTSIPRSLAGRIWPWSLAHHGSLGGKWGSARLEFGTLRGGVP